LICCGPKPFVCSNALSFFEVLEGKIALRFEDYTTSCDVWISAVMSCCYDLKINRASTCVFATKIACGSRASSNRINIFVLACNYIYPIVVDYRCYWRRHEFKQILIVSVPVRRNHVELVQT
jgi:hypothetical protein